MPPIKGHFDGTSIVLDEPASLAVGQPVQVVVEGPLVPEAGQQPRPSRFGFAKGTFEMSDDFNDPLDEFAEYR
jgi:antitoxin (DNA-binding transcriptional repressor) of toxin-antitoxin stability system